MTTNLSYLEFTILDFGKPEIFMKIPDFECKITPKIHPNRHKMNVFAVPRLRKSFPTILNTFRDRLTAEKQS